jgi:catechol 2,3-dioxygenase-like lactoylglutathione lyase family enzyme
MCAFAIGDRSVLLIFRRGASRETIRMSGGIPPHDGSGPLHVAFAVGPRQLAEWEAHLDRCNVAIEGRTIWPRGGRSVYFRDPDGHLLELATPGLWKIY